MYIVDKRRVAASEKESYHPEFLTGSNYRSVLNWVERQQADGFDYRIRKVNLDTDIGNIPYFSIENGSGTMI